MSTVISGLQTPENFSRLWVLPTISHYFERVYPQKSQQSEQPRLTLVVRLGEKTFHPDANKGRMLERVQI